MSNTIFGSRTPFAGRRALLSLAVAGVAGGATATFAATIPKDNNNTNLATNTSWVGGVLPGTADVALFDATITAPLAVNQGGGSGSNLTFGSIQVTTIGGPVTITQNGTGNVLTLNNTGAGIDASAATNDFSIVAGTSGGSIRIASANFNPIFVAAPGRTLTLSSLVNQGNTKTAFFGSAAGTGTVVLTSNSGSGGATSFNVAGGVLRLNGTANGFAAGTVAAGTLLLGNSTAATGITTTVNAANGLSFASGVTAATLGGLAGTGGFALTNADAAAVALTLGGNNAATTYGGALSGLGSVVKTGTNTTTFSVGGQTYAGATTVSGGSFLTSATGTSASNVFGAGAVNLSAGGRVRFNNSSATALTYTNALDVGAGGGILSFRANANFQPAAVTNTGPLTLDIDNGITVTPTTFGGFGGAVTVSSTGAGATLRLASTFDNASLNNASVTLAAGIGLTRNAGTNGAATTSIGTLNALAGSTIGASLAGTGVYTFSIGSRNEASSVAGTIVDGSTKTALAKVGSATLTLSGANTYTGDTTISGGTLALTSTGQLKFVIGASGVNNKLAGTGTDTLDGQFLLDLTNATAAAGDSWNLVASTLSTSYGSNFGVVGFTNNNDGTFTNGSYLFTESTGNLTSTAAATPEPATLGVLGLISVLGLKRRRRA